MKKSNRPMKEIPVPSGLLSCLLLIPLRGQETCQKQAGIPHRERSAIMKTTYLTIALIAISLISGYSDDNRERGMKPTRINAGSNQVVIDNDGISWAPERGFVGGGVVTRALQTSELPEIYLSERYGDFVFSEPLPEGNYKVKLHFCETFHPTAEAARGKRRFKITLEDKNDQIEDLSIEAGGVLKPLIKTYLINVKDGHLTISFSASPRNKADYDPGCISAIEIESIK